METTTSKVLTAVASPMPPPNLTLHTCPDQAPNKRCFVRGEILRGVFHIKAAKNKKHSEFTMVSREIVGSNYRGVSLVSGRAR